jgi:molybdopterin synthase catalytic subunit
LLKTLIEIVDGPIDASKVRGFITGEPTLGGIVIFEGVTRAQRDPEHGALVRLDYEAHPTMARRQLELLAEQVIRQFGAGRAAIVHRVGGVAVAETSVLIGVACGHRAEAFDACRWIIDTLKKDVPIWKKDVFEDGFVRWVEAGVGNEV